jgi:uncharacterized radical SAM superfamily Fe-S cluster-containing enzyme
MIEESSELGVVDFESEERRLSPGVRGGDVEGLADILKERNSEESKADSEDKAKAKKITNRSNTKTVQTNTTMQPFPLSLLLLLVINPQLCLVFLGSWPHVTKHDHETYCVRLHGSK